MTRAFDRALEGEKTKENCKINVKISRATLH